MWNVNTPFRIAIRKLNEASSVNSVHDIWAVCVAEKYIFSCIGKLQQLENFQLKCRGFSIHWREASARWTSASSPQIYQLSRTILRKGKHNDPYIEVMFHAFTHLSTSSKAARYHGWCPLPISTLPCHVRIWWTSSMTKTIGANKKCAVADRGHQTSCVWSPTPICINCGSFYWRSAICWRPWNMNAVRNTKYFPVLSVWTRFVVTWTLFMCL